MYVVVHAFHDLFASNDAEGRGFPSFGERDRFCLKSVRDSAPDPSDRKSFIGPRIWLQRRQIDVKRSTPEYRREGQHERAANGCRKTAGDGPGPVTGQPTSIELGGPLTSTGPITSNWHAAESERDNELIGSAGESARSRGVDANGRPTMIDFEPSEEQALIIETVRAFAEKEIRPLCREADESGVPPKSVVEAAHELGLVANALPEEHGGGGERSAMTGVLIAEELAWGDLAIALAILSPGLLGFPVADFGSESQRSEILPALMDGTFVPGSLAIVEPRFAFDVFHPQTIAKRDGEDFLLDGVKCQVPWLEGGRHVVVVAADSTANDTSHNTPNNTPNHAPNHAGLAAFLLPRDIDGLSAEPELMMGLGGLPTVELTLSGVRVAASARLSASDADLRRLIDRGRVALAAAGVGTARASYEVSRDYAKERETFGQPIATRQAIAFKLADMAIEIDGARLLVWEAASAIDRGEDATRLARLAYDQTMRVALTVTDGAVQVYGGHGYIRDYLPELHLRNVAGFASFESLVLL
jgi:acyl-CoA dehydrogenase